MVPGAYAAARAAVRFVGGMSVRHRVVHARRLYRPGPFVLACTHAGHLEPFVLGHLCPRPVHWVAREEFFRLRLSAAVLRTLGAIELDRRGVPVRAVRAAVTRLERGEVVGIFPEGGRVSGERSVLRGGPIKAGACLIAMRAGVPVVPAVVLGVEALHAVGPWLPGRRTTVRTIVGEPIRPPSQGLRVGRQLRRRDMAMALRAAFVQLHAELLATGGPA